MAIFHKYLTYTNPLLETDDDEESGPLERVGAGVCEILVLYTHKYEEVFEDLLQGFVNSTWMLLTNIGLEQKYDIVCSRARGPGTKSITNHVNTACEQSFAILDCCFQKQEACREFQFRKCIRADRRKDYSTQHVSQE